MTTVTVSLPDEIVARLREKLEPHGYTVEEFASSSLAGFADSGELISPELEAQLLSALDSPLVDTGGIDWAAKIRRLQAPSDAGGK